MTRLIALGTFSIKDSKDKFSLKAAVMITGVSTFAHTTYKDCHIGETIHTEGGTLEWTIPRVPILSDDNDKNFVAGHVGDGQATMFLARIAFAPLQVLKELERKE